MWWQSGTIRTTLAAAQEARPGERRCGGAQHAQVERGLHDVVSVGVTAQVGCRWVGGGSDRPSAWSGAGRRSPACEGLAGAAVGWGPAGVHLVSALGDTRPVPGRCPPLRDPQPASALDWRPLLPSALQRLAVATWPILHHCTAAAAHSEAARPSSTAWSPAAAGPEAARASSAVSLLLPAGCCRHLRRLAVALGPPSAFAAAPAATAAAHSKAVHSPLLTAAAARSTAAAFAAAARRQAARRRRLLVASSRRPPPPPTKRAVGTTEEGGEPDAGPVGHGSVSFARRARGERGSGARAMRQASGREAGEAASVRRARGGREGEREACRRAQGEREAIAMRRRVHGRPARYARLAIRGGCGWSAGGGTSGARRTRGTRAARAARGREAVWRRSAVARWRRRKRASTRLGMRRARGWRGRKRPPPREAGERR